MGSGSEVALGFQLSVMESPGGVKALYLVKCIYQHMKAYVWWIIFCRVCPFSSFIIARGDCREAILPATKQNRL